MFPQFSDILLGGMAAGQMPCGADLGRRGTLMLCRFVPVVSRRGAELVLTPTAVKRLGQSWPGPSRHLDAARVVCICRSKAIAYRSQRRARLAAKAVPGRTSVTGPCLVGALNRRRRDTTG
jgi:hypothetical protein